MAQFVATLKLKETDQQVSQKIIQELRKQFIKYLNRVIKSTENRVKTLIAETIRNSPEYNSLLGGQLQAELGVPESDIRIESIIGRLLQGISVIGSLGKSGANLGSLKIELIKGDFSDLLNDDAASYQTGKGEIIPWLKWLLIDGDVTIIDYNVRVRGNIPSRVLADYSRTGLGLMIKKRGGRWRIPPEFAGTVEDNFITRSIEQAEPQIELIFKQEFKKIFK